MTQSRNGLAMVREIGENRSRRAQELRDQGKKVLGYFCCYAPLEIMTAAGIFPYRIMGNLKENITLGDAYLEISFCPYLRNCFDTALKGGYDFLDGYITPDSCDNLRNFYDIWNFNLKPPYSYYISVPHLTDQSSMQFFREELDLFKQSIERLVEKEISSEALAEAINLHNQQRALLRELYRLRQPDPPKLAGSEVTQILVATMSLPVEEANQMLREVIEEVKARRDGPPAKAARLLVWGPEIDDPAFIKLVEDCGANVVADDVCIGSRYFWHDVEMTPDPMDGLAERYLSKIYCARTMRAREGAGMSARRGDLDKRFAHVRDFAQEFRANGAVIYVMMKCDSHEYDAPDLRDYLREEGLPVLHLDSDYTMAAIGGLRTRLQAFIEMITG